MSKVAFVFPGQASQYVGMGLDFYNKSPFASRLYEYAETQFDLSIRELSFYGPLKDLTQTKVTQPAIFINSIAIFEELKTKNFLPDMVAGHSLGEYSALVATDALTFEEGLALVKVRAEQMQRATELHPGTMAAIVGLSFAEVQDIIKNTDFTGICTVANYNSPTQIAISGEKYAVQNAMLTLKEAGARRVVELSVGGAFHSPLMQEAEVALKVALDSTNFKTPKYPVYSNVTGTATSDPMEIRERLYLQLTSPVLWVQSIENMIRDGANFFLEAGPGKVLQGLIKRINESVRIESISSFEELEKFQWK